MIRGLLGNKKYVIVVEHDLSVLDYLSDYICCLYGKPGAYGVVTMPFGCGMLHQASIRAHTARTLCLLSLLCATLPPARLLLTVP